MKQSNATSTMQGHQFRTQGQAMMGFKGVVDTTDIPTVQREVFNPKDIVMPKMVVKNAPTINPWYGMKH